MIYVSFSLLSFIIFTLLALHSPDVCFHKNEKRNDENLWFLALFQSDMISIFNDNMLALLCKAKDLIETLETKKLN